MHLHWNFHEELAGIVCARRVCLYANKMYSCMRVCVTHATWQKIYHYNCAWNDLNGPEIWWFIRCWLFNFTSVFPLPISFSAPFALFILTFLCICLVVCVHECFVPMWVCVLFLCAPYSIYELHRLFQFLFIVGELFQIQRKRKQIWYLYIFFFFSPLLGSEWCDCKSCIWDWLLVSIVYTMLSAHEKYEWKWKSFLLKTHKYILHRYIQVKYWIYELFTRLFSS